MKYAIKLSLPPRRWRLLEYPLQRDEGFVSKVWDVPTVTGVNISPLKDAILYDTMNDALHAFGGFYSLLDGAAANIVGVEEIPATRRVVNL